MRKTLLNSFLPYLAMVVGLLILIWLLDSYAWNLSRSPEIVYLSDANGNQEIDQVSWQVEEESEENLQLDSLFLLAKKSFKKRKYSQAEGHFLVLNAKYPNSKTVLNYLGLTQVRQKSYTDANHYFNQAIDIDPNFKDAVANLASTHAKLGNFQQSKDNYLKSIELDPNNPDIHFNFGFLLKENYQPEQAITYFRNASELSSGRKKAKALCQLGMVKLEGADTLNARNLLNEAILLVPNYELARIYYSQTLQLRTEKVEELQKIYRLNNQSFYANYYLGKIYHSNQEYGKAEYHLEKALEQDPSNELIIEELTSLYIGRGKKDKAETLINSLVKKDTLALAYFYKAKIASSSSLFDEAFNYYRKAIEKSNGNYPEAYVNMAILNRKEGDYQQAISNYQQAIQQRPNYALAFYNLARIYSEMDSVQLSINQYKKAIEYDPGSHKSWYNLGVNYERTNQPDSAKVAYKEAVRIKNNYSRALLSLGNIYLDEKRYDIAAGTYRDLLKYFPNYTKAWYNLGLTLSRAKQENDAIDAFERLIALEPANVQCRILLAELYTETDQYELAISSFDEALNQDMSNLEVRYKLAMLYENKGDADRAAYQFLKLHELEPENESVLDHLITYYQTIGDTVGFEKMRFAKLKIKPGDTDFYVLGKTLHELKLFDEAIESYQLAIKNGNTSRWVTYWIGKAHMDDQEIEEGMRFFKEVLKVDPGHRFSWYRLGQCYDILGDLETAEKQYERLKEIDPDFKLVRKIAKTNK